MFCFNPVIEVRIRVGRFAHNYGLMIPEHTSLIRKGLGFDQKTETYNLEASWMNEEWAFFLTGILGRPDQPTLQREKGMSFVASRALSERAKVSLNYYGGKNDLTARDIFGVNAIYGFSPEFSLMSEFDFPHSNPVNSGNTGYWGFTTYHKLGYEVYKGVQPAFYYEYSRPNLSLSNNDTSNTGLGAQFFKTPFSI